MAEREETMEALVAHLVDGAETEEDLARAFRALRKRAIEKMLDAEMTEHLGYEKHAPDGFDGGNSRNGRTRKTVTTDSGTVEIEVPRDRDGSFEPQVVRKGQRRLKGFDDKVISLYARGMTTREIQGHLHDIYEVDVSPDLISRVTDSVLEDVRAWQSRPLDEVYPIVYLDALVVKVRDQGSVRNRAVHVALGINMAGHKEVLGLWMTRNEGAKFWLKVMTELRNRGVRDILIAAVDGLTGFPDAIEAVFSQTVVQTCIVHMVRNSTRLVSWRNRKALAADLKLIYRAATEEQALEALDAFEEAWSGSYPSVAATWRSRWQVVRPFFEFSPELRRIIYTTNAIEALNRQLRKVTKTRGVFPKDDSVTKLLWLALERMSRKWSYPQRNWDLVIQQLAIQFPDRVPLEAYARR